MNLTSNSYFFFHSIYIQDPIFERERYIDRSIEGEMNTIAEDVFVQWFEGSVASQRRDKERRPYHRYCSCALHKSGSGNACFHHRNVRMMKKTQPWNHCSLSLEWNSNTNVFTIGRIDQWLMLV